jgi:hypothetical protein
MLSLESDIHHELRSRYTQHAMDIILVTAVIILTAALVGGDS